MTEVATLEDATPTGTTEEVQVRRLNGGDRCDKGRCGAQAFVIALLPVKGELLELTFCGHHGREYEDALKEKAVIVKSYMDEINVQPSPSANAD